MEDLKSQLQRAEAVSEQYQKQLEFLQLRLDEATNDRTNLEERLHGQDGQISSLQLEMKDHSRQARDMDQAMEAERELMAKEKDQQTVREEELQAIIQRLNENLKQRDGQRPGPLSRSSSFRNRASPDLQDGQFAPGSGLERSPSRNNFKLLLQKDKMIESLRLELAESQIKLAEMEHMGDGRLQELEKVLLETRMANARLMEDNESFQLLLSEKTLKGDFMHENRIEVGAPAGMGSLAEELESADETVETPHQPEHTEDRTKLEGEVKALRDQNKALTLYIDRIIGRLLQHEGFEHIIHDKSDGAPEVPSKLSTEKDLPPPPPPKESTATSLLSRARSVVAGQTRSQPQPRPRPASYMPPRPEPAPTAHENPETAPSIPLGRATSVRGGPGHRRSRSDQASQIDTAAPTVVGQMYRGTAIRTNSGGAMSPGLNSPGKAFFAPSTTAATTPGSTNSRSASASGGQAASVPAGTITVNFSERPVHSSSNSITTEHDTDMDSSGGVPSPPRSHQGQQPGQGAAMTNYTGAVMKQNQLRPLRLVQENKEMESGSQGGGVRALMEEDEAARKKANRSSWIQGWFQN